MLYKYTYMSYVNIQYKYKYIIVNAANNYVGKVSFNCILFNKPKNLFRINVLRFDN